MTSAEIYPGDLVYVAKEPTCCGDKRWLGEILIVSSIIVAEAGCAACGSYLGTLTAARCQGRRNAYVVSLLRKIPPLRELDETKNKEEIPA